MRAPRPQPCLATSQITRGEIVALCDLNESSSTTSAIPSPLLRATPTWMRWRKEKRISSIWSSDAARGTMTRLAEAGVPGVIVEKPIHGADDYKALRELEARSETRFVVNLASYHPRILEFLGDIRREDRAGALLDATARLPMAGQGVHVLDLMFAFNGYAKPTSVFGASSG